MKTTSEFRRHSPVRTWVWSSRGMAPLRGDEQLGSNMVFIKQADIEAYLVGVREQLRDQTDALREAVRSYCSSSPFMPPAPPHQESLSAMDVFLWSAMAFAGGVTLALLVLT